MNIFLVVFLIKYEGLNSVQNTINVGNMLTENRDWEKGSRNSIK